MSHHSEGTIYVVNEEAMYWRARARKAEEALADAERRLSESIDTSVRLADTSSRHLFTAIMAGAFNQVARETEPEPEPEKE